MYVSKRLRTLVFASALTLTGALGSALAADSAAAPEAGSWQSHQYQFTFMGFTSTYSCDGLSDKLTLLLKRSGAKPDMIISPLCTRGYGHPDKMAQAKMNFATLQPGAAAGSDAASTINGSWRHVELASHRPVELGDGDCELMEQFRDHILPLFATRNINSHLNCVPNQGGAFSLTFDVFAPTDAAKTS